MNRLASLSGMAQTSANTTGQLGMNTANQVGANLQNAGQARAQGIYGSANAWSNFGQQAMQGIGNAYGQSQWNSNINNPYGSNYIPPIPDAGQYAPPKISF